MSDLEQYILLLLKKEGYKFKREVSFSDCAAGKYRYDFQVNYHNEKILLEIDGIYHFSPIQGKVLLYRQQEHDRKKDAYCLAQGIKLYRIPYWDIEKITSVPQLFQSKYLVKRKGHNDFLKTPGKYKK